VEKASQSKYSCRFSFKIRNIIKAIRKKWGLGSNGRKTRLSVMGATQGFVGKWVASSMQGRNQGISACNESEA